MLTNATFVVICDDDDCNGAMAVNTRAREAIAVSMVC